MKITFTFEDGLIKSYPIKGKSFVIGRSNKCDVCVPSSELSREHCRVDLIGQTIYITDLNSSNGVFIDNVQVRPNTKTKYTTTQQLMMGDTYVIFDLSSAELTRSILTPRALLDSDQTSATRIKSYKKNVDEEKRESIQSTVLTLLAWGFLLTGTYFLSYLAFT
jgi:pSer/pThr/pTyr-binding forkhead associated (FHA) protein